MIRLWGYSATSAMAILNERRYPLVADGGFFWGVLAASADQPPGVYPIVVQLRQENGELLGELATQINVVAMGYPVENIDLPPESTALLTPELVQEEQNTRASVFALFTPQKLWVGPFIIPVNAAVVSPYGIGRSYNGGPVSGHHTGVDLAGEEGDWVAAANSGRVAFAGATPLRGNGVIIDHGAGVFSGYYHLSAIAVQEGQMVNKGDLIGAVGSTGMVTGPHLHWEIVVRGLVIDPIPWTLEEKGPSRCRSRPHGSATSPPSRRRLAARLNPDVPPGGGSAPDPAAILQHLLGVIGNQGIPYAGRPRTPAKGTPPHSPAA